VEGITICSIYIVVVVLHTVEGITICSIYIVVVVLHTVEGTTIKEECIKNEIDYYG
jgi:hypothetical protein